MPPSNPRTEEAEAEASPAWGTYGDSVSEREKKKLLIVSRRTFKIHVH